MVDYINNKWNEVDTLNTSTAPDGVQGGYSPNTIGPILHAMKGAAKREFVNSNAIYVSGGSSNAYVLTYQQAPEMDKGKPIRFWANHNNTGAATLNINGLGARAILQHDGTALLADQIVNGRTVAVEYDGTNFRLMTNTNNNPSFTGTVRANDLILVNAASIPTLTTTSGTITTLNSTTATIGTLNATTLSGSGAAITAIDASNIATGTINDTRLPATMSGKTFNGWVGAQAFQINGASGTNFITAGPGDNATWASHNIKFQGWYGMGMYDHAGNVNGVYDFRNGIWEVKGGLKINGQNVWSPWNFDPNTKLNTSGNQTMSGALNTTGDLSSSASIFANSGNAYIQSSSNRHLWFRHANGTNRGLLYHADSGSLNLQLYNSAGTYLRRMTFAENGELYVQGNIVSDGNMRVGASTYQTDGNILFTAGMAALGPSLHQVLGSKITSEGRSYPRRIGGGDLNFNWSGQGGQPSWLWGGNDGTNMYVYNPSNFNVNWANGAGNADTVDGYHAIDLAQIYKGTNASETNLPIGTMVTGYGVTGILHQTYVLRLASPTAAHYVNDGWGGGAALSGTWRHRGYVSWDGSYQTALYQREYVYYQFSI